MKISGKQITVLLNSVVVIIGVTAAVGIYWLSSSMWLTAGPIVCMFCLLGD